MAGIITSFIRHGAHAINFVSVSTFVFFSQTFQFFFQKVFYLIYVVLNVIATITGSHILDETIWTANTCLEKGLENHPVCYCAVTVIENYSGFANSFLMWFALFG